jgi:DNA polymerase V
MTVVGQRTVLELRGTPCIPLEMVPDLRKGVASTRSFGRRVTCKHELAEAIAGFVDRASGKLRREQLVAGVLQVFVRTDRFREDKPQYGNTASARLAVPSADVAELTHRATGLLDRLYRPGYEYKKAGVMLVDLSPAATRQQGLFDEVDREKRLNLLNAYDAINMRYGRGTVKLAAQAVGRKQTWQMRREHLSPRYTTDWKQLPKVKA